MASLENVQGSSNGRDVDALNTSPSNDQLQIGADALARGRDAGFTDEESLEVYARRLERRQRRDQKAEAFRAQHRSTIQDIERIPLEFEGTRQLTNARFAMARDGGERDQSVIDEGFGRDTNAFSYYDRDTKTFKEDYVADGTPTPDEYKLRAQLRDAGLAPSQKEVGVFYKDSGRPVIDRRTGKQKTRIDYDRAESTINETSDSQTRPLLAARKKLTDAIAEGRLTLDSPLPAGGGSRNKTVRDVLDSIDVQLSPRLQRDLDASSGRDTVIADDKRFSAERRRRNEARAEAIKLRLSVSDSPGKENIRNLGEQPISEYQTMMENNQGQGKGNVVSAVSGPSEFEKMPFAVPANEEAVDIALSLGDDVSPWVDLASGEPVAAAAPQRVQTNLPNTSQQLNAPVASAASWVAARQEGKDIVQSTNMNQSLADFNRRVRAFAPNYESRKVETVSDFSDAIQAVIAQRQASGKNFYLKDAGGKNRKVAPGIDPVMQLLGMTSGDTDALATALYLRETSPGQARPVSSFSDGVSVNMGSLAGENIDLGQVQRKNRSNFKNQIPTPQLRAELTNGDIDLDVDDVKSLIEYAQKPVIGAIRDYDDDGKPIQEPPLTRAKMKGRSPEAAVARYRQLQAQNGQAVDPVYEKQIYEGNASLTADQAIEQQRVNNRAENRVGSGSNVAPPARVAEDEAFSAEAAVRQAAASRHAEGRERIELIKLIKKGAQFEGETADRGKVQRQVPQGDGTSLPALGGAAGRRLVVPEYNDESLAAMTPENGVMKAPEAENNPRSWSFNKDTLSIDRGEPVNTTPGRAVNIEGIRGGADGNGPLAIQPGIRERADLTSGRGGGGGFKPPTATSAPEPDDSANKAVRFASERRKARKTESKRNGIIEHFRNRKGAYGIGAAIGGGVGLAGAGVYAYNQPREEQY